MSYRVAKPQRRATADKQAQRLAEKVENNSNLVLLSVSEKQTPWTKTPLDPKRPYIRVLRLRRGAADDPLELDLSVVDLDENPSYETLSYVWGSPNETRAVKVDGISFEVTINLHDFLCCLRDGASDRIVWADAICINQQSTAEKDHQIGLMGRIYHQAKEAHVWFGRISENWRHEIDIQNYVPYDIESPPMVDAVMNMAASVIDLHEKMGHTVHPPVFRFNPDTLDPEGDTSTNGVTRKWASMSFEEMFVITLSILDDLAKGMHLYDFPLFMSSEGLPKESDTDSSLAFNLSWPYIIDCFHWLLSRAWWRRVWTLQEAVLPAVDPLIHIGSISFRLSRVTRACYRLSSHVQTCCKEYRWPWLAEPGDRQRNEFIDAAVIESFRRELSQDRRRGISHEDAIRASLGRQVSVVRDRVFGVIGLLQDTPNGHLRQLSYGSDAATLYCHFTKACYEASSLDALWLASQCSCAKTTSSALPSWAIDFGRARELSGGRDLMNSTTHHRWNLYSASLRFRHNEVMTGSLRPAYLSIRAVEVGMVRAVHPPMSEGSHIIDYINSMKRVYRNNGRYEDDRFWRTIFMDRNVKRYWRHKRKPMPSERLDTVKRWWIKVERTGNFECIEPDTRTGLPGTYHFREMEMNVMSYRFICTSKGDPGMGDNHIEPLDRIFVVTGSSSLVVLRPLNQNIQNSYRFIGFCFVDGYMYGEALKTRPAPDWQTVQLG